MPQRNRTYCRNLPSVRFLNHRALYTSLHVVHTEFPVSHHTPQPLDSSSSLHPITLSLLILNLWVQYLLNVEIVGSAYSCRFSNLDFSSWYELRQRPMASRVINEAILNPSYLNLTDISAHVLFSWH